MATQRDYYEILNVARDADGDAIKRAFRKLAMKYHPDHNASDKDAEARFKEASEAYEVLSDSQKRQRYDRFGHAGLRGTAMHDFSHMEFGDVFSMFEEIFGGASGGRRRSGRGGARAQRGYDLETLVEITLEDVARGAQRQIEFTRKDVCPKCDGSGGKPGTEAVTCVTCGGVGQVQRGGGMFRIVTTCPACGGKGSAYRETCPECRGSGVTPRHRKLDVKIPAGIHDGQAIRIGGEGEPGAGGGPRGDLHVVVRVQEHNLFTRQDDHLILKMPISFTQAALGAKVDVPTIDGRESLTIKPGTQHGDILRIAGGGLPNLRNGRCGDLVVVALIEIPTRLSADQEKLLRQFAETENHDVLPHSKGFWEKIKQTLS